VTAVEPSAEMIRQRPAGSAPVVQASAESLPFEGDSFDVAMAVLSAHHWADLNAGLSEMLRVARQRVVMVTFDSEALEELWITADYFPEMLKLRRSPGASSASLVTMLPAATSFPLPVPQDCTDHFFAALWARPELILDEEVVRPMWVWQSISEESRRAGRERLYADLKSGPGRNATDTCAPWTSLMSGYGWLSPSWIDEADSFSPRGRRRARCP
jgi:SAM-dependent methyltransferase